MIHIYLIIILGTQEGIVHVPNFMVHLVLKLPGAHKTPIGSAEDGTRNSSSTACLCTAPCAKAPAVDFIFERSWDFGGPFNLMPGWAWAPRIDMVPMNRTYFGPVRTPRQSAQGTFWSERCGCGTPSRVSSYPFVHRVLDTFAG